MRNLAWNAATFTRLAQMTAAAGVITVASCDYPIAPTSAPIGRHDGVPANDYGPASNQKFGIVEAGISSFSETEMRRHLGLIRQSGAKWIREPVYWHGMQPSAIDYWVGIWDTAALSQVRRFVTAAGDSGLSVYLTLEGTPLWARHCDYKFQRYGCDHMYPPGSGSWLPWYYFVRDIVDSLPAVAQWGVWNEPNDSAFLRPLDYPGAAADTSWAVAYWYLFGWAADALHSKGKSIAGPELGGGQSSRGKTMEEEFLDFLDNNGWRLNSNDKLTFHHYSDTYGPFPSLAVRSDSLRYFANIRGFSANEIWVTEGATWSGVYEADQENQARAVTNRYNFIQNNSYGVTKHFWMHYTQTMSTPDNVNAYRPGLMNGQANPAVPKLGSDCFTALARGLTIPSYCTVPLYAYISASPWSGCSFSASHNFPDPVYAWKVDGVDYSSADGIDLQPGWYSLELTITSARGADYTRTAYWAGSC